MENRLHSPQALRLCIMLLVALEFLQNGMLAFGAEHIIHGLHGSAQGFSLAAAIYASVAILVIMKHRWLAETFGYRKFVLGSLVLYMIGALASGLASDMVQFSVARAIQAMGGATFFTAARMQVNLFTGPSRLFSLRVFVMGIFSGSVLAPGLAAWLLTMMDWPWLFWSMLLPAAVAMGMTVWLLPNKPAMATVRSKPHLGGLLVLAAAVFLLQFILERLPYDVFRQPRAMLLLAGLGLIGVVGFIVHEWHRTHPLVAYRDFINARYLTGIAVFFLCYLLAASNGYILPILLRRGLGMSMQQIGGWLMLPFLVCMVMLNVVISLAIKYPGARKYLQVSLCCLIFYAVGMAYLRPDAPSWLLAVLLGGFGVVLTFGMESAAQTALKGIDAEVFSDAYQTKNIMREMAIACGISLATLFTEAGDHLPLPGGNGILAACQGYFLVLGAGAVLLLIVVSGEGWVRRLRARSALAACSP